MDQPVLDGSEANLDDSETIGDFQRLCQNIASCTALGLRSKKWDFLGGQDGLLRIDMLPTDFVEAMEHDYSRETLAALGLFERVDDELRLPNWINNNVDLYVAIDESNETITFSAGDQYLFPMKRTALDLALERNPPDSTQAPAPLFIVETPEAAKIIQQLGLHCVSCEGLDGLDGKDIRRLFSGDARSDFGWRFFLLLADFDVAGIENQPVAALEQVIDRLADAEDVFAVNPSRRFGVCRPTASEFQNLVRAVAFKDEALVRHTLEDWSARSVTVGNWRSHLASVKLSFAAASRALTDALQLPNGFVRQLAVQVALPAYRAAGKEAVMQKFFDAIDRERDPFDQLSLITAAGCAENFFENDPLIRSAEAILAGEIPASARELRDESFNERLRCTAELRRIQRDRHGKRHGL